MDLRQPHYAAQAALRYLPVNMSTITRFTPTKLQMVGQPFLMMENPYLFRCSRQVTEPDMLVAALNEYDQIKPKGKVAAGWDVYVHSCWKKQPSICITFNYSVSENGTIVEYPKKKFNFSTDVITEQAVKFIDSEKKSPFFLLVGYYNPHSPYISAPRHKETFRNGSGLSMERPYSPEPE